MKDIYKKLTRIIGLVSIIILVEFQQITPVYALGESGFVIKNKCETPTDDSNSNNNKSDSSGESDNNNPNVHPDVSIDFDENTPAPIGRKNAKKLAQAVAKAGEKLYNIKIDPGLIYGQWVKESGPDLNANPPLNNEAHNLGGLSGTPPAWLAKQGVTTGSKHAEDSGIYMNFPNYKLYGEAYISGYIPSVPLALKAVNYTGGKVSSDQMSKYVNVLHEHGYFTDTNIAGYISGVQAGYAQYYNVDDVASDIGVATTDKDDEESECGGDSGAVSGDWNWPFPDVGEGSFMDGQLFGTHPGNGRTNSYHDGLDFGSVDHPGSEVHAIHSGKVIKVSYAAGLDCYVVTKGDDNLSIVYQEFTKSKSNVKVKEGDTVKTGDIIGIRDSSHLHISITKMPFDLAISHPWDSSGGWLDPLETIREGIKKGGSSKSSSTSGLSAKEDEARKFIIAHESGGNYSARNPNNPTVYGAYQLKLAYLKGDLSKENQDRTAQSYMKERYGTWVKAKEFWVANNWW